MRVKIKKLSEKAVIPTYGTKESACVDITATKVINDGIDSIWYGTDIAMEIPEGYCGVIIPRSSISKMDLELANSIGQIDSDYRGEIQVRFNYRNIYDATRDIKVYNVGDKIAQFKIVPKLQIDFLEVDALEASDRGEGGFGSTGV